jgi:replication initiator protein RepSA
VYKRDARQLVRAGLTGGKGIPDTITTHPCVFATITAPSFGPVHARRMRGKTVLPCRPSRDHKVRRCPHGHDISCPLRHHEHDPRRGRALCGDCYDYQAAVLFNAHAGILWRRFTTYLPRHLARLTGLTQQWLRALVRVRYVKVAEYQARGVVHFHAVIRLDVPGDEYQPPPARFQIRTKTVGNQARELGK